MNSSKYCLDNIVVFFIIVLILIVAFLFKDLILKFGSSFLL